MPISRRCSAVDLCVSLAPASGLGRHPRPVIAGRRLQPVIARIAAADGPAGCLVISLCWWAGKPSEIEMFNLTESSVVAAAPRRASGLP